jgi:uncharacterized coiled-coil DUF342 family protein
MDIEIKKMFEMILAKIDSIEQIQKATEQDIKGMGQSIKGIDQKIDKYHNEVLDKLETLEKYQDTMKNYILKFEDTFKKVEEDHRFIQNLKKVLSQ